MRAVVQRVARATVKVDGRIAGEIGAGFLALVAAGQGDDEAAARALAEKIVHLRVFEDDGGKMNRSLLEVGGELLVVSQFTLFGDCRKGRRPSFVQALEPGLAATLVERVVACARALGVRRVETGIFGASMQVELVNDGPVTLLLDTERTF
jgi:D-tyrosyl-tRNA(Tyr) deacylase